MGIKTFKPTSKGVRFRTNSDYADITSSVPEKSLTKVIKSQLQLLSMIQTVLLVLH